MELTLRPAANEAEFGDPALCGDWVDALPKMLDGPQVVPWCSYAVRDDRRVVGLGGFKGPPDEENHVEIAYLTLLPEQGRGIATRVARQLVAIAAGSGPSGVLAHTLPEENASSRVLLANGFAKIAVVDDPEDGAVWRWFLEIGQRVRFPQKRRL